MIEVNFPERGLTQLVYMSRSLVAPAIQAETVRQILIKSIQNNRMVDVTGLLVSSPTTFMQILEGPSQNVRQTYERVHFDERHTDVEVKLLRTADQRMFKDWNMTAHRLAADSEADLWRLDGLQALELLARNRPIT